MISSEEEKQKFDEIYELKKQIVQLKQEREQINVELDAITIVKEHNEQFKPGNTDQFESKVVEYKEFTDQAKGTLLTGRLKQVDDKIVRAQNYIDNLMSDIIRSRMQLDDGKINSINLEKSSSVNVDSEINKTQQTMSTTSLNNDEQEKTRAFNNLKKLYKKADLKKRVSEFLKGRKPNWNKIYKNYSTEEMLYLIDVLNGNDPQVKQNDLTREERLEKQGLNASQINKRKAGNHWLLFVNGLNKKPAQHLVERNMQDKGRVR